MCRYVVSERQDGRFPIKVAVITEIKAHSEEWSPNILSVNAHNPGVKVVAKSEPSKTDITAEKKTKLVSQAEIAPRVVSKSAPASTKPTSGNRAVIDGRP